MAEMENLSENVRSTWNFISHIMRKEPNKDCTTASTFTPKLGHTQDNVKKDCREGKERAEWKSYSEVYIAVAGRAQWRESVEWKYESVFANGAKRIDEFEGEGLRKKNKVEKQFLLVAVFALICGCKSQIVFHFFNNKDDKTD